MEAVVDDLGIREPLLDGFLESLIHVDRDDEDLFSFLGPESLEETPERSRALPRMSPDHAPSLVIDHNSQELAWPTIADLINSEEPQVLQQRSIEFLGNHALCNPPCGQPTDAEVPCCRGLVGALEEPRHFVLKDSCEHRPWLSPWHRHGLNPAPVAMHPKHPTGQIHLLPEHPQVSPPPRLALKAMKTNGPPSTSPAPHAPPAGASADHNVLIFVELLELHLFDDCSCQPKDSPQE